MEQMEASSPEETVDGAETEEEMRKRHKAEVRVSAWGGGYQCQWLAGFGKPTFGRENG